jgi:hypothetical protein
MAEAKKAYEAGLAADENGDGMAAIAHFQRSVDFFPVYSEAYAAMAATAKRISDEDNLRYATFFDARMDMIARMHPRVSARAFEAITWENSSKGPRIINTARSIVIFLDAVSCEKERKDKKAAEEKISFIARYGIEGWLSYLGQLRGRSARGCPNVTIR